MDPNPSNFLPEPSPHRRSTDKARRPGFSEDFRRFFLRGLAALLPTLITLSLLLWVWDLLWNNIGRYILLLIQELWVRARAERARSRRCASPGARTRSRTA